MSGAWIQGYGCTSSAGPSTAHFWQSLQDGVDHSEPLPVATLPGCKPASIRACLWKHSPSTGASARDRLVTEMLLAFDGAMAVCEPAVRARVMTSQNLGVIFASTKSCVDDYVWQDETRRDDAFGLVLHAFLESARLVPDRTASISSACASSLSALFLAHQWLRRGEIRDVLIVSADRIGDFVARGFWSLRAATQNCARPFSPDRNGLQIGEGAAVIVLSSTPGPFELDRVAVDVAGFDLAHSAKARESLERACRRLPDITTAPPDLIIAHGTATRVNDAVEDRAFHSLFGLTRATPPITGTKWCIGHTLGASGAMDVIAACEALRQQRAFRLANTPDVDPAFLSHYLNGTSAERPGTLHRALTTSLGFGGVQAAASITLAS